MVGALIADTRAAALEVSTKRYAAGLMPCCNHWSHGDSARNASQA